MKWAKPEKVLDFCSRIAKEKYSLLIYFFKFLINKSIVINMSLQVRLKNRYQQELVELKVITW